VGAQLGAAARLQDAGDLGHRAADVVDVLEDVAAVDEVEAGVLEGQRLAGTRRMYPNRAGFSAVRSRLSQPSSLHHVSESRS
jgi:hypothetical protein